MSDTPKTTDELAARQQAALEAVNRFKDNIEKLKNVNGFLEGRLKELEGGLSAEDAAKLRAEFEAELAKSNGLLQELQNAVLEDEDEPADPVLDPITDPVPDPVPDPSPPSDPATEEQAVS